MRRSIPQKSDTKIVMTVVPYHGRYTVLCFISWNTVFSLSFNQSFFWPSFFNVFVIVLFSLVRSKWSTGWNVDKIAVLFVVLVTFLPEESVMPSHAIYLYIVTDWPQYLILASFVQAIFTIIFKAQFWLTLHS